MRLGFYEITRGSSPLMVHLKKTSELKGTTLCGTYLWRLDAWNHCPIDYVKYKDCKKCEAIALKVWRKSHDH